MDYDKIKRSMGRELDETFRRLHSPLVNRLNDLFDNDLIELRLLQLANEARRLSKEGKQLTLDNPVVKQFFVDYAISLVKAQVLGSSFGSRYQDTGFRAGSTLTKILAGVGDDPRWKTPKLEQLQAALDLVGKPEFSRLLPQLTISIQNDLKQIILNGIALGQNPRETARQLKDMAGYLPYYRYEALMRTTQLTAYREASAFNQLYNKDIIEYQIRYATLDGRTCVACIALHGQELPAGQRIDDHYNGRCTGIPKVKFLARPEVQTGIEWFEGLPPSKQREYFHNDKLFDAYQSGQITLPQVVGVRNDPVFGKMTEQRSYIGITTGSSEQYLLPKVS